MAYSSGDEAKLRSLLLLSSSTAEHIINVCKTAEFVLQGLHSPSQARNFSAFLLPTLLQKIFGFQEQEYTLSSFSPSSSKTTSQFSSASSSPSQGWLSVISSSLNGVAANAIISLLSPSGVLFTSLLKLDKQNSSLRFFFPTERLPDWVQHKLKGMPSSPHSPKRSQSSLHLPKLFADRMKPIPGGTLQVQLDTFEYFFFWFAYYAVCKGTNDNAMEHPNKENSALKKQKNSFPNWVANLHHHRPSLPNWAALHTPSHQRNIANMDPYLQLLQSYLAHYVPGFPSSRNPPSFGRLEYDRSSTSGASSCTEFLLQTFTEFWLVDEGSDNVAGYVPPSSQLTDAVRVLINYMNKLHASSSVTRTYSQIMQRPLYRFLRRPFRTWTAVLPMEKASNIVDVWLDFLQPWVSEGNMTLGSEVETPPHMFSERWQGFVSANYLFYTNLTVSLLEFALKYMHCNLEAVLQMISKILNVLAGTADLSDHLKHICSLFNDNDAGSGQKMNVLIAAVCDQLQRLEDVDCNWPKGCSHVASWSPVRLFSKDVNGGEAILELLILQAEGELHTVPHTAHASCKKALEAIKKAGTILFGTNVSATSPILTPVGEVGRGSQGFQASTALPQHTWKDVKYKGDWMRRPIESTEYAWLVRLLVRLSDFINMRLDLSQERDVPELQMVDQEYDGEASDNLGVSMRASHGVLLNFNFSKMVALILWCVCTALSTLLKFVRGRGWRLNLRFLAKKPIAVAAILLIVHYLRKLTIAVLSL